MERIPEILSEAAPGEIHKGISEGNNEEKSEEIPGEIS